MAPRPEAKTIRLLPRQPTSYTPFLAGSKTLLWMEWVDGKSNEIKALPKLLDRLDLRGMVVTMDAMGAQTALVEQIVNGKADAVVCLNGNQGNTHEDVKLLFSKPPPWVDVHTHHTPAEKDHGRMETREGRAISITGKLRETMDSMAIWPPVKSLISVTRVTQSTRPGSEPTSETRYFLSTLPVTTGLDVIRRGQVIRAHWGVENNLHRTLDVVLHEDDCLVRDRNIVKNMAVVRRLVLAIVKNTKTAGTNRRQILRCQINHDHRDMVLAQWNKTLHPSTIKVITGR